MTLPTRRALIARVLSFPGLPDDLLDPLSSQVVKLTAALSVFGLGAVTILNLEAIPRPVFLAAPLFAVLFLSLDLLGHKLDSRSRLVALATLVAGLGLAPVFRFESIFAGVGPFIVAATLLAMARGTKAAIVSVLAIEAAAFYVGHPWRQISPATETVVAWFLVSAWSACLLLLCGLLMSVWTERLSRSQERQHRLSSKVNAMQRVMAGMMTSDSPETRQWAQIRASAVDRMLSDSRLRLAAEGHLSPGSAETIDLFTWRRLFEVVSDGLAANPVTAKLRMHLINKTPINEAVLADAGRIVAIIYGLAQHAVSQRQATNIWVTIKSEAIGEGRARCGIRFEDDGEPLSPDALQTMLTNPSARNQAKTIDDLHLIWLGQCMREIGASPLFAMSKFGGRAVGFNLSVETVSLGAVAPTNLQPLVLVVDDDAAQRVSLKRMIETSFGARVLAVATATEALKCIEELSVNLVVTDYYMPEVDGAELTQALRQMDRHIPVVAVTVANSGEQQEPLWSSGVDLVLPKPVSQQSLSGAMQRFISAHG